MADDPDVALVRDAFQSFALLTFTGRPKDEDLRLEVQLGNTYELVRGRIKRP
jgi:hypothetical protein